MTKAPGRSGGLLHGNKKKLCIEILTRLPLSSAEDGRNILQLWAERLPTYLPERFGNWEPVDREFQLKETESILRHWRRPFLATRNLPAMESAVWMRKQGLIQHSAWSLSFGAGEVDIVSLVQFVTKACCQLKADFGCLTLLTDQEIELGLSNGTITKLDKRGTRFNFGIYSHQLQSYVPDFYWLTVLGEPYVAMFGRENLLSLPIARAEKLDENMVALQLTKSIEDIRNSIEFSKIKERVKDLLGKDAFFEVGHLGEYRRPHFVWSESPQVC